MESHLKIVSQLLIKGQVVSLNANLQLNAQPMTVFFFFF